MKLTLIILAAFGLAIAALHAQTPAVPPVNPEAAALTSVLPASWQGWATIALVLVPLLGRAWHAWTTNGGAMGIWNAIVFGTNTPGGAKVLLASLCLLTLTSCAGFMTTAGAFLGSPAGQAVVAVVATEAKQLENTWEAGKIPGIIDKAKAAIAKLPAKTGNPIKDLPRDMQEQAWNKFISLAQDRYKALTGGKYVTPVTQ